MTLSRHYVKLCDLRDFADPAFRAMLRDIQPGLGEAEEVHRKYWEYAMLGLYLDEVGALRDDCDVLAVAAGHEAPLYWLANRVRRVVATDIYGEGSFGDREADAAMLNAPATFAPYPYREDRLEVVSMDARRLEFADESFDVVYSLSSIEHFGGPSEIQAAASEMARVLRPGGHLLIATECFLGRPHLLDVPIVQFAARVVSLGRVCSVATPRRRVTDCFTPKELRRDIVDPSGMTLAQPLDTEVSPETFANVLQFGPDGTPRSETGQSNPHIVLRSRGAPWTSAFLALQKN
jgi:SAM-dependent methyltransferase